ncbi:hypothetical protein BXZ70DRAFT_244339 [Cristinia sonorae]|uniref:Uncharacterized protein n=1 Tax=Cristinia sonorae TaxID=1940300 RepID=A0A8K0XU09_9AGAR|nr:hypothetical protein BXZ70DRAFT_244339 [Cristinia sonorae]
MLNIYLFGGLRLHAHSPRRTDAYLEENETGVRRDVDFLGKSIFAFEFGGVVGVGVCAVLDQCRDCQGIFWVAPILVCMMRLNQAVFTFLRLYAIWGSNLTIGLSTFVVDIIPIVFRILMTPWGKHVVLTNLPDVLLGYCLSNIIANGLTLALTSAKTYSLRREAIRLGVSFPLASMLLKDGSFQFLILTLLNIAEAAWGLHRSDDGVYVLVIFLSSILISHFILNLRQVNAVVTMPSESGPSFVNQSICFQDPTASGELEERKRHGVCDPYSVSRLRATTTTPFVFGHSRTSFVGNLGAPLRVLGEEDGDVVP